MKQKSLSHLAEMERVPKNDYRPGNSFRALIRPMTSYSARLPGQDPACLGLQLCPKTCVGLAWLDPGGCQQCAMISLRSKAITEADTAIRLQQRGQGADHFCLLVIEISCQKVPKIAQVPTDD